MKVLMFGWEFPPHITGGLGTACFGLTNAMVRQGIEVLFVVPKVYGDESQEAVQLVSCEELGIDIHNPIYRHYQDKFSYITVDSRLIPYQTEEEYYREISRLNAGTNKEQSVYSESYIFSGGYGANLYEEVERYALVAATIASKYDFDVIHVHDWLTYKAGIEARRVSGKPLVIHVHATEFDRSGEDNLNSHVYGIEKYGMEQADKIFTVSNLTKDIVVRKYGQSLNKVTTVHNGVDIDWENIATLEKKVPEKIVTFLGRITFQKGPIYFVEAAHKVLQKEPNVRFVMAGSGDMLNEMVSKAARLGISDKFNFTGFLKGDDVDKMFSMSDIYVMPSVSEPFGISPLEAMRAGVPVIISKQSGVSEVLEYAVKVDFWDVDAIADAIYGLLHYPALDKVLSGNGKREVNTIQWDNAAKIIKEEYRILISTK